MHRSQLLAWLGALVVVASLLALSRPVSAQPAGGNRAEAEQFFRAGEQAYNSGQYLIAAQAFEQAYELLPLPAIAFSTAQAYRLQYFIDKDPTRLKRSIDLYRVYVTKVEKGGRRDDAVTSLAELEPILSRIEAETATQIQSARVAPATTQLMVSTQVAGAKASIGDASGQVPFIREVAAGEHMVRVEADGYFPVEQRAIAVEGRFISVEVALTPMPARVKVRAEAGAKISIDGRPVATTPLAEDLEVPAGKHFVTIMRNGRRPFAREVALSRGETTEVAATLVPTTQRRAAKWVVYGAAGVFAGALGTGLLAWRADSKAADILETRTEESIDLYDLDDYNDWRDTRDGYRRATYVLAGLGTVTIATALALYFFDEPVPENQQMGMGAAPASAPGGDRDGPGDDAPAPMPLTKVQPSPTRIVPGLLGDGVGVVLFGGF